MRILLVNPKRVGRGQSSIRYMNSTPLALPILKALTPDDIEVRIIDENYEPIPYDEHWDLVGITVMLHVSPMAIEISKKFRSRGIKTAFGGFFPTLWPDEARDHVDVIVAGEAEYIWKDVIGDLRKNSLKPFYKADKLIDLKDVPIVKRDYFSKDDEFFHLETTRGCPYNCDFCSVTAFYGAQFRHRPVEHVIQQLEELKGRQIFFVDDNITGNPKYARELFNAMIPLKIKWSGQFSLNNAERTDIMELAAESGCQFLFTGIESISQENLEAVNKTWAKSSKYADWIKKTHDAGIAVYGSFIFGFDGDKPEIFKQTLDFCEENEIELALFSILFPIKGSKLHHKLLEEGRIFETDATRFNGQFATFHPKQMTAEELDEGTRWIWQNYYSKRSIKTRLASLAQKAKDENNNGYFSTYEVMAGLNMAFKVAVGDF